MSSSLVVAPESGQINVNISLTASKSESNRALIMQALTQNPQSIANLAVAQDTQTLQALLESRPPIADVGPAGTTMRFLAALLASSEGAKHTLTGSARMLERPIGILVDALRNLGAEISYADQEGFPPLEIAGRSLEGGKITMDGSVSSQFVSAILMIAPCLKNGLTIEFDGVVASRPYLEMTCRMMRHFGAEVSWTKANSLKVKAGGYCAAPFTVEADWSAASYWYMIAALSQEAQISVGGLRRESMQGDHVIQDIYEHLGVSTAFHDSGLTLTRNGNTLPTHFHYDFSDCPDVAQTVVCTCAALGVDATLTGLESLRIKETDRSLALKTELEKFGQKVTLEGDHTLHLEAKPLVNPTEAIATYHDHRMAMAFAPLALAVGSLTIADPEVVAKSYPDFWRDLAQAGFSMQ